MKKLTYSVLAASSLAIVMGATDAEASSYKVKSGDSLWKIASAHHISLSNLKQWNNLSTDAIFPNQVLVIEATKKPVTQVKSSSSTAPVATTVSGTYKVKSGDTLSKIAKELGTTVTKLQSLNGISTHLIYVGQSLKTNSSSTATAPLKVQTEKAKVIPKESTTSGSYTVVAGDTLSGIAHQLGISVTQLESWNSLTSSYIRVGQLLKIENRVIIPQKVASEVFSTTPISATGINAEKTNKLISLATSLKNTPYVWGGSSLNGFDCSGFIHYVYNTAAGLDLPRTNTKGLDARSYEISNPQVGDLVFFSNTYTSGISHVGIYLGNGSFIHAGGDRVQVSSLTSGYWKDHFDSYKRFYAMD